MKKSFWFGLGLLVFLIAVAIFEKSIAPDPYGQKHLAEQLAPPSAAHIVGQNQNGEDLLSLLVMGTRASLWVGFLTVFIAMLLGTFLGLVAGYSRGWKDDLISRLIEIVQAFPGILLAIACSAVLGPSLKNIILSLSISAWIPFARLVRGQVLSLKERDFVLAARSLGASTPRILLFHLLPNLFGLMTIQASFSVAQAILAESSLSFLGLGVPPGVPSWGKIASDGARYLWRAPHLATFPGIVIMLAVLSLNFVGDGLKSKWDRHD